MLLLWSFLLAVDSYDLERVEMESLLGEMFKHIRLEIDNKENSYNQRTVCKESASCATFDIAVQKGVDESPNANPPEYNQKCNN